MRLFYKIGFTLSIAIAGILFSQAYDFEVDGIYYNILEDNQVEVTKGEYEYAGVYEGDIFIPSSVNYNNTDYSVTSIGERAFERCGYLISVNIPGTVTSIEYSAFGYCFSLTSIDIPSSVISIGDFAFVSCSSLSSVTIPESVTSIGRYAFRLCSSLTSMLIPASVTSIANYAFSECESLISINIPPSVTSIGIYAFEGCYSLPRVVIPESVTHISDYAFYECESLNEVTCLANALPSLGTDSFSSIGEEAKLYVYESFLVEYKNSEWAQYFNEILPITVDGVELILDSDLPGSYIIYNLNGINVLNTNDKSAVEQLPTGLYIINGKKVMIGK